jgi:hypothetical protein
MQLFRSSSLSKTLSFLDSELDKILSFIIAFATSYTLASLIKLKAGNPYDISNVANAASGWNPETNYARIIATIVLGLLLFWGLSWFRTHFSNFWFRILISLFATMIIFLGILVPTATTYSLDPFHSGEQLAPSLAYHNGEKLFSDIFTLHGAGADILIPNLAFTIFNHGTPSIGSYVLIGALLQTLSTLLFFILVARFIKSSGFYLFTVLYFLLSVYSGFSYEKNIPLYIVIGLIWLILHKYLKGRYNLIALGAVGLISSLSILWSYDVGVILIVTSVLLAALLVFCKQNKDSSYKLKKPERKLSEYVSPLLIVGGGIVGQLVIIAFLGIGGYSSFLQTFFEITKYQGLMFDYPLLPLDTSSFLFWLPVILFTLALYMFVVLIASEYKRHRIISTELLLTAILIAISILYLRFGVGRPDQGHIAMASPILFLTGFFIVRLYAQHLSTIKSYSFWPIILFIVLLFWPVSSITPTKLFSADGVGPEKVKEFLKLPQKKDNEWLNSEQLEVTNYIRDNSKSTDSLFVLVPEPLYYYTTDRKNVSRFAITWFADPKQYTGELLNSLEKNPPKFIIYDSSKSPYRIGDGIPIYDRIPEVTAWVKEKYTIKTMLNETTILSK